MSEWFAPYVGIPFGEGPGQLHCWGLVRKVYADRLGIQLPVHGDISPRDLGRVARAMADGSQTSEQWVAVGEDDTETYDVVLMRRHRLVVHVGVMVDQRRVLHIEAASHSVVVPVRHMSVAGRIVGYRRHVHARRLS